MAPSRIDKRDVRVVTNVRRDCDGRERVVRRKAALSDGEGVQAWRPSGRCQVSWETAREATETTKRGLSGVSAKISR